MSEFDTPSSLFRWCLLNAKSGNETFSYEACFPYYVASAKTGDYLWTVYDRRLGPLIERVRKYAGLRILEVGCGFGHDLIWTAQAGARAVGIDVNSAFVDIAGRTKSTIEKQIGFSINADIRHCNLLAMPETEKFDFIYMKDVFHHLEPREEIVSRLAGLLAPKGTIMIVEPNAWNPLIQLQMFRIRGFRTIAEKKDPSTGKPYVFGNERLVTGGKLCRIFQNKGIQGTSNCFRLLPTRLSVYPWLARVAQALENTAFESFLWPICVHTLYVGRKP
jgi:SAM-dependent methyltransferase